MYRHVLAALQQICAVQYLFEDFDLALPKSGINNQRTSGGPVNFR
jgi:hypothetical protein